MLINNRNYLRLHQRDLLNELTDWEKATNEPEVIIEVAKKGLPTAKLPIDGRLQYLHSKYDPAAEAEKLVDQLENLTRYNHVLFIGTGLGYHIQALLKNNSIAKYSIYEPNKELLSQFLSHQDITQFSKVELQKIITTQAEDELKKEIAEINNNPDTRIFVFMLPSCSSLYSEQQDIIMNTLKDLLKDKRSSMATNFSFQKRWTINSLKNFSKVLETPNILHDVKTEAFKKKPALLVAAGPALNSEFENLKYIKEKGLAYIISVGSAINALIEHDIYPDAACAYDPTEKHHLVFQKVLDEDISTIPLVFGSSVGFEILDKYKGPMLHMLTNQDTVAPYYLNGFKNINVVLDAPSISIIAFQLLKMLECSHIILVGQNLAYEGKNRYSKGINYNFVKTELSDGDAKNMISVESVDGSTVFTDEGLNRMRQQLEMFIKLCPEINVINTTKGGAKIEGTPYKSLENVIEQDLQEKDVVVPNWYEAENHYEVEHILQQQKKLMLHKKRLDKNILNTVNELREIDKAIKMNRVTQLKKNFNRFDKEISSLRKNPYFKAFIEPMMRIHMQKLSEEMPNIRFESDIMKKAKIVTQTFGSFIIDCQQHVQFVAPLVVELQSNLEELEQQVSQ